MIVPFKYYLHGDSFGEQFSWTFRDTPVADMSEEEKDELLQKIGSPFYEVTLECELDTETGDVRTLRTSL